MSSPTINTFATAIIRVSQVRPSEVKYVFDILAQVSVDTLDNIQDRAEATPHFAWPRHRPRPL